MDSISDCADTSHLQTKTEASILQNRESQRRSRARRRDLVEDLKRRLEEYEKRDALASLEMQRAARAVNAENQSLRTLLWRHGVSQNEVDHFLASEAGLPHAIPGGAHWEDHQEALRSATTDSFSSSAWSHPPSGHKYTLSEPAGFAPYQQAVLTPGSVTSQHPSSATSESAAGVPHPMVYGRQYSVAKREDDSETEGTQSPITDPNATEANTPQLGGTNALESSCDAAAAILVQLHKQSDPLTARAALGCPGTDNCSVKNTTIFQLMEGWS